MRSNWSRSAVSMGPAVLGSAHEHLGTGMHAGLAQVLARRARRPQRRVRGELHEHCGLGRPSSEKLAPRGRQRRGVARDHRLVKNGLTLSSSRCIQPSRHVGHTPVTILSASRSARSTLTRSASRCARSECPPSSCSARKRHNHSGHASRDLGRTAAEDAGRFGRVRRSPMLVDDDGVGSRRSASRRLPRARGASGHAARLVAKPPVSSRREHGAGL